MRQICLIRDGYDTKKVQEMNISHKKIREEGVYREYDDNHVIDMDEKKVLLIFQKNRQNCQKLFFLIRLHNSKVTNGSSNNIGFTQVLEFF